MTGKRKTKKKIEKESTVNLGGVASPYVDVDDSAEEDLTATIDRLNVLGESVAELFSRMDKIEKMFEALTSSAPVEPKVEKTEVTDIHEYTVPEGEIAMSIIAKKVYGNAGLFNRIAAHNYDRYPELRMNANEVKEGWVLRIPPAP